MATTSHTRDCERTTLLSLVWRLGEQETDEREIVETVVDGLSAGRVQLTGNFRGHEDAFFAAAER